MGATKADEKAELKELKTSNNPRIEMARRLLAELIGTFTLTFVSAGGEVVSVITHGEVSEVARAIAPALVIMAMTYTFGGQSGAHFNPGVTLAFALRRDFPWTRVAGYWLAQFAGAILAALLLRGLFGMAGHVGANQPHFGIVASLVMEIVLTFFLITVILGTATSSRIVGPNAALAVGGTIALDGLVGIPVSGASMNTALSFGPALVSGDLSNMWIYVAGPFAGALLAVVFAYILRGKTTPHAVEVAKGD
jgi:aquaporin Z